jgi:hypothetical protein
MFFAPGDFSPATSVLGTFLAHGARIFLLLHFKSLSIVSQMIYMPNKELETYDLSVATKKVQTHNSQLSVTVVAT